MHKCRKCNWQWLARTLDKPVRCANPTCRTPYWESQPIVYVMPVLDGNTYKIGCTDNLKSRYKSTRAINSIIHQIPCGDVPMETMEQAVHALFQYCRAPNDKEHFNLSRTDLDLLDRIQTSDNPMETIKELSVNLPQGATCLKCGYQWRTRSSKRPEQCPRCTSRTWDKPREPEPVKE